MRTSSEIEGIFQSKGCEVVVSTLGHSYRAGGEIFIYSPDTTPQSTEGFQFIKADFQAFDGTGYDGRGRKYDCWLVKAGDFLPATEAEYNNASAEARLAFGEESRSCSNRRYFVHKDELSTKGLADLGNAFAALGL